MFSSPAYPNCHGNVSILGLGSRKRYPRVYRVLLFAQFAPGSSVSLALGGLCLFLFFIVIECDLYITFLNATKTM